MEEHPEHVFTRLIKDVSSSLKQMAESPRYLTLSGPRCRILPRFPPGSRICDKQNNQLILKWKAVIKEACGANMHILLCLLSVSALSFLLLLPYVFIYPAMRVACAGDGQTLGIFGTSGSHGERVLRTDCAGR